MKTIKVKHYYEIPSKYTGIVEYANGDKWWYLDGKCHRIDGPAVEYANGTKWWYLGGKRHRTDGPAIEWDNGDMCWCLDGKRLSYEQWLKKRVRYMTTVGKLLFDKKIK